MQVDVFLNTVYLQPHLKHVTMLLCET